MQGTSASRICACAGRLTRSSTNQHLRNPDVTSTVNGYEAYPMMPIPTNTYSNLDGTSNANMAHPPVPTPNNTYGNANGHQQPGSSDIL